jgi:hypothetical protein
MVYGPKYWIIIKLTSVTGGLPEFILKATTSTDQREREVAWINKTAGATMWGRYTIGTNNLSNDDSYKFGGSPGDRDKNVWAYNAGNLEVQFLSWGMESRPGTQDPEPVLTKHVSLFFATLGRRGFEPLVSPFPGPGTSWISVGAILLGNPKQGVPITWQDYVNDSD